MRNLKFPEIDKKVQQSVYGAWGGSNSNDPTPPPPPNGGWYDNGDGITIIGNGSGGGSGSSGDWDNMDNGSYDNGAYWGASGGSGGSTTGYYDPIPNLPKTVEQQLGSMGACVSYAMSFMSGVLGHPINGVNMVLHNSGTLNIPVETAMVIGLTPAEATTAMQSYFYTTTLTSAIQIINAIEIGNHGVLANLFVYDAENNVIPNLSHVVALVDYDATTGLFTAADSDTGAYETYTADQINIDMGVYQINGVKP